jgi:hypothetical protein
MWHTSVLNNLFFYFKIFFCHGPKSLKQVCYPSSWLSIAVILLPGNTKETVSPERISATRGARRTIPGLQNYGTGIYVVCFSFEDRETLRRLQKI